MSANTQPKPLKPSDYSDFAMVVYKASATCLEFDQYEEIYHDLLVILFWNPDVDLPLAIKANNLVFLHDKAGVV